MKRSSKADALLEALPYFQQFRGRIVDGFRYTDEPSMKIIDRVLTEVISPSLAGKINELGGKAEVLSGKEVLVATKAPLHTDSTGAKLDLGFVGDITEVHAAKVQKLIDSEIVPIISPVGRGADGQLYNINADIAAAKIAQAIKAHKIIYLSDVNGVRRDPKDEASLISTLTPDQIETLKEQGVIAGGMIPKINSALEALAGGVAKVHFLDGKQPNSLLLELFTDAGIGTEIAAHKDKP